MSSENVSSSDGRQFRWNSATKTVEAVDPSGNKDPDVINIGAEDTKFFAERS